MSLCKIVSIKENVIEVDKIDAFDGTPVMDLKPYTRGIDCCLGCEGAQMGEGQVAVLPQESVGVANCWGGSCTAAPGCGSTTAAPTNRRTAAREAAYLSAWAVATGSTMHEGWAASQ